MYYYVLHLYWGYKIGFETNNITVIQRCQETKYNRQNQFNSSIWAYIDSVGEISKAQYLDCFSMWNSAYDPLNPNGFSPKKKKLPNEFVEAFSIYL